MRRNQGLGSNTITLYHYTTYSGYKGIEESKTIRRAFRHSYHGPGVYFNSRRVNNVTITKYGIAKENYLGGKQIAGLLNKYLASRL